MRRTVAVEVAMQHNDSYTENTYGFINNINTLKAVPILLVSEMPLQTHLTITPEKNKLLQDSRQTFPVMISEKATAIVSVKIGNPQFEGQTKQKLGNSEARGAVDSVVSKQLRFSGTESCCSKATVEKSVLAQKPERQRVRHEILPEGSLPLTVCPFQASLPIARTRIRKIAEIYIVEVILQVVLRRQHVTVLHRLFFLFVEKF